MSTESDLFCEEYELGQFLTENEKIINIENLERLEDELEELIFRAKHYDEYSDSLKIFIQLQDDINFIRMGARP